MPSNDEKKFLRMQNQLMKIERDADKEIVRVYARSYRAIMKKIKALYDKYAEDGSLSNMDKTQLNRLSSIGDECIRILRQHHAEVEGMLTSQARLAYGESFFRHAYYIDDTFSLNLNWGKVPYDAVEAAIADNFEMVARSQTFRRALNPSIRTIREIFERSLIEGWSYDRVRDQIIRRLGVSTVSSGAARYMGRGVSAWAMTVARTEVHRAISLGQQKTIRTVEDNDLDIGWMWNATLDGRTRPEHGALDGQRRDKENNGFYVPSIGWVQGPGLSGVASFDINCRCTLVPMLSGEQPTERYVRGQGIVKYQTYKEWKDAQEFTKG